MNLSGKPNSSFAGTMKGLEREFIQLVNESDLIESHSDYGKGSPIFTSGFSAKGIFIVQSGRAKLQRTGNDGKIQIFSFHGADSVLGTRELLSSTRHFNSLIAMSDCRVAFVNGEALQRALGNNPALARLLTLLINGNLNKAENQMLSVAYNSVRDRLVIAIVELVSDPANDESQEEFRIELTREELAQYVCTAKETIIRLLSEFRKEGVLKTKGKLIWISSESVEGLKRLAKIYL